jgi:putative transposase
MWALRRRRGAVGKRKRVERRWRRGHRQQPPRPRQRHPARPPPDAARTVASSPRHVWSDDFVQDACLNGTRLRLLPVLDAFTRECLAIEVATSVPAARVLQLLEGLFATGAPAGLRRDNGPESIAASVRTWLATQQTSTLSSEPGHPWENGITERFNGTLRDECLKTNASRRMPQPVGLRRAGRGAPPHRALSAREHRRAPPDSELGDRTPAPFKRDGLEHQQNAAPS